MSWEGGVGLGLCGRLVDSPNCSVHPSTKHLYHLKMFLNSDNMHTKHVHRVVVVVPQCYHFYGS